jgi:DnaJ family protein C protein 28
MAKHPRSIDDQIRKAIEEGAFDDLPGKGKPMDLGENPFEDPSWRMANLMLRSSGFSLPWIENRKGIEVDYREAVDGLKRTWRWRLVAMDQRLPNAAIDREWERALDIFRDKATALNKRIFNYNLEAPLDRFKLRPINLEKEIDRVKGAVD